MAIVSTLAAVITLNAVKFLHRTKIVKTVKDMKTISAALLVYQLDTGSFPDPFYFRGGAYGHRNTGCAAYSFGSPPLMANEDGVEGWDGPYLESVVRSPLKFHRKNPGDPGYTYQGVYWIGGTDCYRQSFDLDSDGVIDTTNAVSVQLAGLTEYDAVELDEVIDGNGMVGRFGTLNVYYSGPVDYHYAIYFVGTEL